MRITVLGSGSSGNATLVEAGETRLLVDAGLAPKTVRDRARAALGLSLDRLDGVVVTHAHADHAAHAASCGRVFDAPVYLSEPTRRGVRFRSEPHIRIFGQRAAFRVGTVEIHPLPVPHDAPQVAVVIAHAGARAAVVTDVGRVTGPLVDHLRGCGTVLVESNYDPDMLAFGPYPPSIQRRIRCGTGHLANAETAELLRALGPETDQVVLMHLSEKNNRRDLAHGCAMDALAGRSVRLSVADPVRPTTVLVRPRGQLPLPLYD